MPIYTADLLTFSKLFQISPTKPPEWMWERCSLRKVSFPMANRDDPILPAEINCQSYVLFASFEKQSSVFVENVQDESVQFKGT